MARKRNYSENTNNGAPAWMTTYGDMVTLLLCFFVLLFSFSTIDAQKFKAMMASFQGSLGILDSGTAIENDLYITEAMEDNLTTGQREELEDFRKLKEALEEYLESYELDSDVLVSLETKGLMLRFQDNVLFDSGRADLKANSKDILRDIAGFLQKEEYSDKFIRIEGHTDTDQLKLHARYETNWELSVARASNVVRFLIEEIGLAPERFSASGYGEYHPVVPNDTPENKAQNRRVDIVILRSELVTSTP